MRCLSPIQQKHHKTQSPKFQRGVSPPTMGPSLSLVTPTSLGVTLPMLSPGMMSPGLPPTSMHSGYPTRPGMMGMPEMAGHPQQIQHGFRGPPGHMFRPRPGHGTPGMGIRMM